MTHGSQCTCYACVSAGPTSCGRNRCVLRAGHPGDCAPPLRFARMLLRELRHRIVCHLAGERCSACGRQP